MLIGFIVVIIMVLVIVGLMAVGNSNSGKVGVYSAQIKKLSVFVNNIESEGVIYHGLKNNFEGFNANYLQSKKIGKELYTDSDADVPLTMTKQNWDNLPADFDCDGTDEADTVDYLGKGKGVFLLKGTEAGNQKAFLIHSCNGNGTTKPYTEIRIIGVKAANKTYDPKFDQMLENVLMTTNSFYYGA